MTWDLLFDLDGTLTDPERGITRCIQHALVKVGWEQRAHADFRDYIGPPLRRSFAQILCTKDETIIEAAITA
jgi:phosphoglycolate phosphatase